MQNNYTTITELPGNKATNEQVKRLFQRYRFAREFIRDKDVLEVACGSGQGVGYIAKYAKKVIGGDIDDNNLKFAKEQYRQRGNIEIRNLDAHNLSFKDNSFDVVILYEAIYYLKDPEKFIEETYRILREEGVLIICTVNKNWSDFNPSPYSYKYFSIPELRSILNSNFTKVNFYGGFKVEPGDLKDNITSFIKRMAVKLNLMPKTMKGKELFKRLFFGKLHELPPEITDKLEKYEKPQPIPSGRPNSDFKVIYAIGYK